tara:strand:+ start:548 stop:1021 length:474 start_codon:yes stop_codon:yes gene_type:complete
MKKLYQHNDGGRDEAGFKGATGDCVIRAIAIAMGIPYQEAYDDLHKASKDFRDTKRCKVAKQLAKEGACSPRKGVYKEVSDVYIESKGWRWQPTMSIGSGCKVHLRKDELPSGKIITRLTKHFCAVIDGVIQDTYDPSRNGTRCVYGYYYNPQEQNH